MLVEAELQKIFAYQKWNEVLLSLGLKAVQEDFTSLVEEITGFCGSGESPEHKQLKEFVAHHPNVVGLPDSVSFGQIEFSLPSGDSIDVLFQKQEDWLAVEVKSSLSPVLDIARGLFQCVKYRAVIEALQATRNLQQNARAVLVLEGSLPPALLPIKNTLGIQVIERINPNSR